MSYLEADRRRRQRLTCLEDKAITSKDWLRVSRRSQSCQRGITGVEAADAQQIPEVGVRMRDIGQLVNWATNVGAG